MVVELCPGTDPEYFAPRLLAHVILHGCDGLFGGGGVAVGHNASDGKVGDAEKSNHYFCTLTRKSGTKVSHNSPICDEYQTQSAYVLVLP